MSNPKRTYITQCTEGAGEPGQLCSHSLAIENCPQHGAIPQPSNRELQQPGQTSNNCDSNLAEKTKGFRLKHKLCLQITASTPKRKHLFYQRGVSFIPCSRTSSDYFRKLKTSFIHLGMIKLSLQIVVQIHKKDHLRLGWLPESPMTSKVNAGQEQSIFPRTKVIHWAALYTMVTIKRHYIPHDKKDTDPRNTENVNISSDEVTLKKETFLSLLPYQSHQWPSRISLLPLGPTNLSTSLWDLICFIKYKTGLCVLILTEFPTTPLCSSAWSLDLN